MKTFTTLYKKASTGADLQWRCWADGDTYYEEYGQIGGKLQRTPGTKCAGKNIGRANGTTPEQQAQAEALAKWEKKQKAHNYTTTLEAAQAGESSDMVDGGILPMLAHKYKDHSDKVKWPAYAQRKLDGHRCIAVVDAKGKCTLWSRTRKPILSMPHIVAAVERQCAPGTVLDGELFASGYNGRFEELTSLIRPAYAKPGHELLEYWVYDCSTDAPFSKRTLLVQGLQQPLVTVETVVVQDENEMRTLFQQYIEEGFEGLMLRDGDSKYVGKRSVGLLKVKERDDSEFVLVGVEEGKGKLSGHGIFVLRTPGGKEFRAKMKGDTSKLKQYWDSPKRWIGRQVTVAYQGLTSDGIPRFPVAVRFKDDI